MPPGHQYASIEPTTTTNNYDEGQVDHPSPLESATSDVNDNNNNTFDHDGKFFSTFFHTRPAMHILLLTLLMSLGTGSVVSTIPGLLGDRFARLEYGYDGPPCSEFHDDGETTANRPQECRDGGDAAQNAAASAAFVENMIMLVLSSVVGSMSDCRGRRVFLAGSFALMATTPLSLVLIQISDSASPYWYYSSKASHGLISSFTICLTILSDVMPREMRSPSYGLFLATYLFGFGFSQIMAKSLSHLTVAIAAAILLQMGCIFTVLIFRETLPEEARRKALSNRRCEEGNNSWGKIILRPLLELSILNRNTFFRLLAVISLCSGMIYSSDSTLIIYYMKNQLDIGYQSIATMFFVKSLVGVLVQIFLLKLVIGCLQEKRSLVLGLTFGAIHNVLWGVSTTQTGIFAGLIMSEFAGLHFPILVGMRSVNVGEEEQGRVQGAFFALAAIADAVGPVFLQSIYRETKDTIRPGPGFMFVVAGCVYLFGAVVACMLPADKANVTVASTAGDEDSERDPEGSHGLIMS
eukprot:CAMPEP_0201674126 /NCGR_PEP_ID=MMETSP0494-20130426/36333_1 /ASSEMBLY_ACC=CAM_ASM_000839 /TAXON_ID=420259 /ORGANISM="Thalassiosira gravida, Strain GMp14c1" /LENGTH=522 /DNA_ID=CAMNT_0048156195 /DNA_START=35 /DNA_END=1603 /DNA_ORIENTATION=-